VLDALLQELHRMSGWRHLRKQLHMKPSEPADILKQADSDTLIQKN
jgi:hypothetical protein